MRKRLCVCLVLIALLAGILPHAACAEGTINLTLWDFYEQETPRLSAAISDYEAQNPNVKIDRTTITRNDFDAKIVRAAAANQLPDIFVNSISRFQAFADSGIAADITDLINQYGVLDNYYATSMEPLAWQGRYYGLPMYNNVWMLYYNIDMMEAKGITQPPKTWDEFYEFAKALSDPDQGVYGTALTGSKSEEGSSNFLYWLWQGGGDLYDLESAESKSAFAFIQRLVRDGYASGEMINWKQADSFQQFLSGRAASTVNGSWQLGTLNSEATFRWDLCELPIGLKQHGIMGGEGIGISADSKEREEALKFILFLHQPDNYLKYECNGGGNLAPIPAVNEFPQIKDNEKLALCTSTLVYCKTRAYGPNYPEISGYLQDAIQANILLGDVDEITRTAAAQIEPLLPAK